MAPVGFQSLLDLNLLHRAYLLWSGHWVFALLVGYSVALPCSEAQTRVVSLAPSLTEIVDALGAVEKLVGVSSFCEYPEVVKFLPKVGGLVDPSLETIVRLKPDLLLALETHSRLLEKLTPFSIPSLVVNNTSIREIEESYMAIGVAVGREKKANDLKQRLRQTVAKFRRIKLGTTPKVVILLGQASITKDVVAGSGTLFDEIIQICGGTNIVARKGYGVLSLEDLVRSKPDVLVIISSESGFLGAESVRLRFGEELQSLGLGSTKFEVLDEKYLVTPGARVHKSIEKICGVIRRGA